MEVRFVLFLIICVFMTRPTYAVKNVKFNKMLKGHTFRTIPGISLNECWSDCETRAECRSINYKRNSHLCHLNSGAQPLTLTTQPGMVFHEKPETTDTENVECGSNTCDKNKVCDTETKTCRVKECTPPKESDSVDILGNMASIGSKKHVSCKEGFIPTAGSKFATVAECHTDGWENDLECVPLTCKGLADMGENTSGMYKSYDESSQIVIDIFCEFNDGIKIGYSYLAPGTLSSSVNISKHYTRKDHVMLRHVRNDNVQYESKMETLKLPAYWSQYNISVFNSGHTDFDSPMPIVTNPYLYMGFLPNTFGSHLNRIKGYSCNGYDYSFKNCDVNKNNYMAVFQSQNNVGVTCYNSGVVKDGWKHCSAPVPTSRNMPTEAFFDSYEIGMGGCGCFERNCETTVLGIAHGLPFDY